MIEVQNYLKKTYQMEPEEIEEILAKEECYIVTFFCSIAVREKSQARKAIELKKKKTPSLTSENSRSKPGRRKKFSPEAHLNQKTEMTGKRKTVDRSDMLNGSKESVIRLFCSKLGHRLYFEAFCKLWIEYVEEDIQSNEQRALFREYLEDIRMAVKERA